jgi:hypothetical protein
MTCDSLRDFLAILDQNGQLLSISDEVAPEPDLGAAGRSVNDLGEQAPSSKPGEMIIADLRAEAIAALVRGTGVVDADPGSRRKTGTQDIARLDHKLLVVT